MSAPHANTPAAYGYSHIKGTGKPRTLEAIRWALSAYWANPRVWLCVGLVVAVLHLLSRIALSNPVTLVVYDSLIAVARLVLEPLFVSVALQQTLSKGVHKLRAPKYVPALGVLVANRLIVAVLGFVAAFVVSFMVGFVTAAGSGALLVDPGDPMSGLTLTTRLRITEVTNWLVMPFALYAVYFAADNAGDFKFSLIQGIKEGARTYPRTLLLALFNTVIGLLTLLPFRLVAQVDLDRGAAFVLSFFITLLLLPLTYLATAHAYRHVSGGPVPRTAAD